MLPQDSSSTRRKGVMSHPITKSILFGCVLTLVNGHVMLFLLFFAVNFELESVSTS